MRPYVSSFEPATHSNQQQAPGELALLLDSLILVTSFLRASSCSEKHYRPVNLSRLCWSPRDIQSFEPVSNLSFLTSPFFLKNERGET